MIRVTLHALGSHTSEALGSSGHSRDLAATSGFGKASSTVRFTEITVRCPFWRWFCKFTWFCSVSGSRFGSGATLRTFL